MKDNEYIYNWVEKFDMLCESPRKIGLIGSAVFLGYLIGLIFVPKICDEYGRKKPFIITMIASCIV